MPTSYDVAVIVGSLRKESFNRKAAHALIKLAPANLKLRFVEIADLPLYNEDSEAAPSAAWTRFRDEVRRANAVLFVTPEYNRSMPGGFQKAIDVGSRPYGQSVFARNPGAVVTVSTGAIGGFGSNHHLRQSAVFLDMPMLQQPEMYIGGASKLFDAAGELANDDVKKLFQKFIDAFAAWLERHPS